MFYDQLKKICEKNSTTVTKVVSKLGLSSGNLSKWKNGGVPKSDTIKKLSEYFNVSADYLLGDIEKEKSPSLMNDKDLKMFEKFKSLTPDRQELVLSLLDQLGDK